MNFRGTKLPVQFQRFHCHLPEEIIHDIFSRLPVQTLSGCRFVCKDWFNIIKDPAFIELHHSRIINTHKSSSVGLLAICHTVIGEPEKFYYLVDNKENNPDLSTSFKAFNFCLNLPAYTRVKIVGSVNGLICLSLLPLRQIFYICNPVTREMLKIPEAPSIDPYYCDINNHLQPFYPASSGFAFHASTQTYKVTRTWYFKGSNELLQTGIEILTLGSGVWRKINGINMLFKSMLTTQVFLNGALHLDIEVEISELKHCIGAIDIGDETFRTFGKPEPVVGVRSRTFSSCCECLCLIDEFYDYMVVWTMKQYGVENSWTRERAIIKESPGRLQRVSMKNDNILLHGREYQACFDLEKRKFHEVQIDGIEAPRNILNIVVHVGSLISPTSIAGTGAGEEYQVLATIPARALRRRDNLIPIYGMERMWVRNTIPTGTGEDNSVSSTGPERPVSLTLKRKAKVNEMDIFALEHVAQKLPSYKKGRPRVRNTLPADYLIKKFPRFI